jgi:hypothetical protein
MRQAVRRAALALLVIAVVATGCGGDGKKAAKSTTTVTRFAPPRPVNNKPLTEGQGACGLVTQAEVASAVGLQANAGTGVETGDGGSSCRWTLKASGSQLVSIIEVVKDTATYEDRIRKEGGAIEDLAGVGDHAFLANNTAYVIKGGKLIILSVATTQAAATRKAATAKLAQSAATRM